MDLMLYSVGTWCIIQLTMLYKIAHFLRDRMPWIWNLIDGLNSFLFSVRYGKRINGFRFETPHEGYKIVPIQEVPANKLANFFEQQPEEAYKFFRPHAFDEKTIKGLQQNRSFLAYVLTDESNGRIAGYCFNRSFFHGKGFRGRMVDISYRGKGLGTMMNRILNEVGFGIGLKLFETVNKDNIASYRSAMSASNVKVVEELEDGDLYLEILKD